MKAIKGGEFLIRDVLKDDIFITEEFTEEQKMMKEAVVEFIDREVWPEKERLEHKDYALTEELMRSGSGGFAAGIGSLNIALPPIVRRGTGEQKERFVRPVLEGKRIAALGVTEPGGGSDCCLSSSLA